MTTLRTLLDRLQDGGTIPPDAWGAAVEALPARLQDVVLAVMEAVVDGERVDMAAIAGELGIHRTTAQRRLEAAAKRLPETLMSMVVHKIGHNLQ